MVISIVAFAKELFLGYSRDIHTLRDFFMITPKDKKTIQDVARKYRASRVLLFGSSLSDSPESRDIDIAVEGVNAEDYFAFYGELLCSLSKPVDIVDLSQRTKFVDLVLSVLTMKLMK